MNKEEFLKELHKINIKITDKQLAQLEQYYNILLEENKKYNLTSITNKEEEETNSIIRNSMKTYLQSKIPPTCLTKRSITRDSSIHHNSYQFTQTPSFV